MWRCGFEEVGFDEMFIMQSAEIFGDGGSSSIACPDKHIRHAFFVSPSPPDRCRGVVSSATISTHWRTRNVQCVSYLYYRPFFTRGSKVLPLFFLCKVGMKRLCGKGAFLLSQKFFRKRCSFLCTFSKPVKGENFLRYPLSSKPNDFMPLIARKNQGSTPMPLLK